MANPLAIELHASSAEAVSGQSVALDAGTLRVTGALDLLLDVTDVAGVTPSLIVTIETSPSGGATGWRSLGSFDSVIAPATFPRRTFAETERYVRARWTIAGAGASFTFALGGEAHQLYCVPSDLGNFSIPAAALASIGADVKAKACLRATDDCEAAIAPGYTMPITAWPSSLRGRVADAATFYAMKARGFNPDADPLIVKAYDDAETWFKQVGNGRLHPPGIVDTTPTVHEHQSGAAIVSSTKRSW